MQIIDRLSATAAVTRLRALVVRLRRSMMAQRPAIRWGLIVGAVLAVASSVYWVAASVNPIGVRYLSSGRRFSSEDLTKIVRVLEAQRIEYHVDGEQKITVSAEQFEQAAALVAKLNVGPRPIEDARDQANSLNSWFEPPREREKKEQLGREKMIESMIAKLDGVVWSFVSINRPRPAAWSRTVARPTAFVYIETDGDRQLPFQAIQSISGFLEGCERDLTMGSITIMDRRGHRYLDPANPSLSDLSRNRAREEELSEEILRQLDWIKGVRVQVRVIAPALEDFATASQNRNSSQARESARVEQNRVDAKPNGSESEAFTPVIGINRPVDLEPDIPPHSPNTMIGSVAATAHATEREHGRVLVNVPRSYYFNAIINKDDRREPSKDELDQMVQRTEKRVRTHVDLVVAGTGSWEVSVDMITDDIPIARPPVLSAAADQRRRIVEMGIIAVGTVLLSLLIVAGSRFQAARKPVRHSDSAVDTRRYHVDSASASGPSERVRELIRRNPEAAASVLQRWTGQGGRTA